MYRKEGILGLFKGNVINCIGAAPFTALEFYLYEFFKNNLWPDIEYNDLTLKHKLACGAAAGHGTNQERAAFFGLRAGVRRLHDALGGRTFALACATALDRTMFGRFGGDPRRRHRASGHQTRKLAADR